MLIEEIAIATGSGGVITGLAMKLLPMLLKRENGKHNGKCKAGIAKTCLRHGDDIVLNGAAIEGLCTMATDQKEHAETSRKEAREDMQRILDKIDRMMEKIIEGK